MWNKSSVMREKSVFHAEERKSLFFLKFLVLVPTHTHTQQKSFAPQKKLFNQTERREPKKPLSCVCVLFSRGDTLSRFVSDRLSRRISQISLHLVLSRGSIALFYKEVFIYQNTVILLLSMHRREREQKAQILSLS